jgi:hypothetical protein
MKNSSTCCGGLSARATVRGRVDSFEFTLPALGDGSFPACPEVFLRLVE